jgi:dipeptidyl-peptidase-3
MSPSGNSRSTHADTIIHQLDTKPIFDALEPRHELYCHYLARTAWHGSCIVMRQVSPESPHMFDFIMDLSRTCDGKWETLVAQCNVTFEEVDTFLEYAATFLCNLGNYYVRSVKLFNCVNC